MLNTRVSDRLHSILHSKKPVIVSCIEININSLLSCPPLNHVIVLFFRKGCLNMFEELHRHQVPLLIFSAGVGDIIVEVISQRGKLYENMKVVSNYMDFNGQVGYHHMKCSTPY